MEFEGIRVLLKGEELKKISIRVLYSEISPRLFFLNTAYCSHSLISRKIIFSPPEKIYVLPMELKVGYYTIQVDNEERSYPIKEGEKYLIIGEKYSIYDHFNV